MLLDPAFQRAEDLDLSCHVESTGRFVADEKLGILLQSHSNHEPLQLSARDLVGKAPANGVCIRQVQASVQTVSSAECVPWGTGAVHPGDFGDLSIKAHARVEGGSGALRYIGNSATSKGSQDGCSSRKHFRFAKPDFAATNR